MIGIKTRDAKMNRPRRVPTRAHWIGAAWDADEENVDLHAAPTELVAPQGAGAINMPPLTGLRRDNPRK